MKQRNWLGYAAAVLVAGWILSGCSEIRKLAKSDPAVNLHLPAQSAAPDPKPNPTDTAPQIISFRKQDGTELFLAPVTVDSLSGEKIMSVAIDEVVISASNRRNLAERNGKIDIEFVVTVPEALLYKDWQLQLRPQLRKGPDTLSLDPLVYSGDRFRRMQQHEYDRYADYRSRIVDSAEYFDRFGNQRAYENSLRSVAKQQARFESDRDRLQNLTPEEAMFDRQVGWTTQRERRRQYELLRAYVRSTDRKVTHNITYTKSGAPGEFDHLNDYFAPRYRYAGVDVLPGGEVFTRVGNEYPDQDDRLREAYLSSLNTQRRQVRHDVAEANRPQLEQLAAAREAYTGFNRPQVDGLLGAVSDSAMRANYNIRSLYAADMAENLSNPDSAALRKQTLHWGKIARNRELDALSGEMFDRLVPNPYVPGARLDTVIRRTDGSMQYFYTESVSADENTSKLYVYLAGEVGDRGGRSYRLQKSDTLVYNVASMTTFLDETPRYMQRIVLRDAEANARFFFTFPSGQSTLDEALPENRQQISAVRELTRQLMTDPVYIIDSITLRASASPEGTWVKNAQLARERSEALRRVLISEFRTLYDSLYISASYTTGEDGREVLTQSSGNEALPNLPHLLHTESLAEDWPRLTRLIAADTLLAKRDEILAAIINYADPDAREWRLRTRYPKEYARIRTVFYPQLRAVDFRFNLHRRGMQQDTVYTTELDSGYMHAVELLKKRRYEEALTILRPYEDRNTALAYMSLGYDAAAYRILRSAPGAATTADIQYMLAILASRLNDEKQAVQYFLRAVELRENLKFRGNLDPEISYLIRKYGLFREEFE